MARTDVTKEGKGDDASENVTLGEYLASIRNDRKFSLRFVEDQTKKQVSNAYLSQIETGKIQQPSPNILYALSDLYAISYEKLMQKAGYITPTIPRDSKHRHGRAATFSEHNLTAAEERELMQYLEFMRRRDSPK